MITVRRSSSRGLTDLQWLKSYHSFSFGGYYDPSFKGYESLRVFNEDFLNPSAGFPAHQHANMEILSYVVDGTLKHEDNLGSSSLIQPYHVQKMSAGKGIMHSEYNPDQEKVVHFIQIWITPKTLNIEPSYEQKVFLPHHRQGCLQRIASREKSNLTLYIDQDVNIYLGCFDGQESVQHPIKDNQRSWLYVVRGTISINGFMLTQGDSAEINKEQAIILNQGKNAEVMLFDFLHA